MGAPIVASGNSTSKRVTRRVLLVEDEGLLRALLEERLRDAGFDVCSAHDAQSALAAFRDHDPDAVVTDQELGSGATGVELVSSLRKQAPWLGIVIVSNYPVAPAIDRDALSGVAYLRKRDIADPALLVEALETVLADGATDERFAVQPSPLAALTANQVEVLRLIARGLSNQEIADLRGSTLRATEQLVRRIFDALDIPAERHKSSRVIAARMYFAATGAREP